MFKRPEVVDNVASNQRAATEGPPVNNGDAERRVEVFVLWELLQDNQTVSLTNLGSSLDQTAECDLPALWHRPAG